MLNVTRFILFESILIEQLYCVPLATFRSIYVVKLNIKAISPHVLCQFYSLQPKKKKNISHDTFGTKFGRLHMQKQDLAKLQTRKMKGLRKRRGPAAAAEGETSLKTAKVEVE